MIAVFCHDAGGAEIVSSWLLHSNEKFEAILQGPAVYIFNQKFPKLINNDISRLEPIINKCDYVLCGTSWQSDIELSAIAFGKKINKNTISIIDHWVCYKERFIRNSIETYPDEIWVSDDYAEKIALKTFIGLKIKKVFNYYLDDMVVAMSKIDMAHSENNILYICEPIGEQAMMQYGDERYWGYNEFDALYYFISKKELISKSINKITLRLHPSEKKGKYDEIFQNYKPLIDIGSNIPIIDQISKYDIIVGCESMAMVIGLIANKRVISCIPPGFGKCSLPHETIEHLVNIEHSI
jgi:hypothetical protein